MQVCGDSHLPHILQPRPQWQRLPHPSRSQKVCFQQCLGVWPRQLACCISMCPSSVFQQLSSLIVSLFRSHLECGAQPATLKYSFHMLNLHAWSLSYRRLQAWLQLEPRRLLVSACRKQPVGEHREPPAVLITWIPIPHPPAGVTCWRLWPCCPVPDQKKEKQ